MFFLTNLDGRNALRRCSWVHSSSPRSCNFLPLFARWFRTEKTSVNLGWYTLWYTNSLLLKMVIYRWLNQKNMIFHSYVSFPEGTFTYIHSLDSTCQLLTYSLDLKYPILIIRYLCWFWFTCLVCHHLFGIAVRRSFEPSGGRKVSRLVSPGIIWMPRVSMFFSPLPCGRSQHSVADTGEIYKKSSQQLLWTLSSARTCSLRIKFRCCLQASSDVGNRVQYSIVLNNSDCNTLW